VYSNSSRYSRTFGVFLCAILRVALAMMFYVVVYMSQITSVFRVPVAQHTGHCAVPYFVLMLRYIPFVID
jgi:hypothetical protein